MAWLDEHGYETPNGAPEVKVVDQPWYMMQYKDGTVYVSDDWNGSVADKGLLLHEMWHHQQDLSRECIEFEREAYMIQRRYYATQGNPTERAWVDQSARKSCTNVRLSPK